MADPLLTVTNATPSTSNIPPRTLQIGTRASALAIAQTDLFKALLAQAHPTIPTITHPMTTSGDHNQTTDLHSLASAGKSLWTHELEARLLAKELDVIVHSLKDVPTKLVEGCVVRAVGGREESRDCVVMSTRRKGTERRLGELAAGAVVGTSSVRRAAMIRRRYPGLVIKDVRGNVGTRLRKLDSEEGGYDCLVLAGAGVQRLGLQERVSSWLGGGEGMLGAVGQGALGVEYREGDEWVERVVSGLIIGRVGWGCSAERMLLRCLEGGCSVPVGAETTWEDTELSVEPAVNPDGKPQDHSQESPLLKDPISSSQMHRPGILTLHAMVVSLDGQTSVSSSRQQNVSSDAEAEECGFALAKELVDKGAGAILEKIGLNRGKVEDGSGA